MGSQMSPLRLWLSLYQKRLNVVTNSFDPKRSETSTYLDDIIVHADEGSKIINQITLTKQEAEDNMRVCFKDEVFTSFRSLFKIVDDSANAKYGKISDGFLGLAPYTADLEDKERNFLYQLKTNNLISKTMFSIYLTTKSGNHTHIKFGGYDEEAFTGDIQFIKTRSTESWQLQIDSAKVGNISIDFASVKKYVHTELTLPFIYVPSADFTLISKAINSQYDGKGICNPTTN
jgi:hypothetical protein